MRAGLTRHVPGSGPAHRADDGKGQERLHAGRLAQGRTVEQLRIRPITASNPFVTWRRDMSRCSILIPVFNKAAITQPCLEALLATLADQPDVEVLVVNDASTDATADVLAGYSSRLRVL